MSSLENLIKDVKSYPELYDIRNLYYNDFPRKEEIWKTLNKKYNIDVKMKWKYLREKYVRMKRRTSQASGSVASTRNWELFLHMRFLDDKIKPKNIRHSAYSNKNIQRKTDSISENSKDMFSIEIVNTDTQQNDDDFEINNIEMPEDDDEIDNKYTAQCNKRIHQSIKNQTQQNVKHDHIYNNDTQFDDEIQMDMKEIGDINHTIKTNSELSKTKSKRTEEENFGIVTSKLLFQLTLEKRARAKAHIIEYLSNVHLMQISEQ